MKRLLYDTEAAAEIPVILTVADVAGLLKVGRSTIYRLIESGQLVAIRIASGYRIRLDHLHAYLDSQTTSQETQHDTKAQRREYLPKEPRRQMVRGPRPTIVELREPAQSHEDGRHQAGGQGATRRNAPLPGRPLPGL